MKFLPKFFLLVLLLPAFSFAQNGVVRGTVTDKTNGEPVIFTNVWLDGTGIGASTDINGFYSISEIPVGNYILMSTAFGYDTTKVAISITPNKIITQKLLLSRKSIELQGVEIIAKKEDKRVETLVSVTKITAKDIQKIPSIGGESDIAQYLQVVPGIVTTGDQGGELFIRGGAPIENKVLLDGMTIYNPFHSIGLFSVFETDIIRNANVLTAGFNAEYGGRMSAVIDITTRDGNKNRFGGKVSASPFMSKLMLEGPVKKLDEKGSSITYLFSGKSSYLNRTSKTVYSYIDTAGLPYSFNDLYGKMAFNAANGSKLNIFGFNFNDHVDYQHISKFNWKTYGAGVNFVLVPENTNSLISGHLSYSDYKIALSESDAKPRSSEINGFDMGVDFTYFLPHNGEVKYGFVISGYKTDFSFVNPVGLNIQEEQSTTELSGFVLWKKVLNKLVIEPSLRLQYYASLPAFSPEPRIAMKLNASDKVRLKLAGGIYSQNFISTKADKDIVDLFTGFLTAPDNDIQKTNGEIALRNLQRAYHAVFGVEADLSKQIELNIEPYYKYYGQLISLNRNKIYPSDPDFEIETGNAYGLDLLLKYDYKNLYVTTGYSLGYVTRFNGQQEYPPYFDRRHNANVVVSYSFGKNRSWTFDTRWNLGSGFPFTKTQGFYEYLSFLQSGINTDYTTANGDLGIIYDSKLNTGRLPYYHRLDAAIKKTISFSDRVKLELNASVINIYNRKNIFYFDRVSYKRVNQLPVLPSVGASLTF